jgi:predicted ArsR family transcriptional regulator
MEDLKAQGWFTSVDYAAEHGIHRDTARKRLATLYKKGQLDRQKRRESRTRQNSKWEQRPIVAYYKTKETS